MATLGAKERPMFRLFFSLVVIGLMAAVLLYYNVKELNLTGKAIKVEEGVKELERPNIGFLLEYRDRSVANELFKKVRVLCWVMTQPSSLNKVRHIKATWGKRCNVLLFISTVENKSLHTIGLQVQEGEEYQWAKTKAAFRYVYDHHRDDADWFMKADDDTYVIVENLRYMLADHNSKTPIYFGCRFKHKRQIKGYMSGGAGYVLSRAALDKLVNEGLSGQEHCRSYEHGQEDLEMGICLSRIDVKTGDSRDLLHRGRFFPFRIEDHLFPNQDRNFWYWNYIYHPTKDGLDCCSKYAISFHYIKPKDMHVLDYLIYQLRPYGIDYKYEEKPRILNKQSENTTGTN